MIKLFCNHNYELINQCLMESEFDMIVRSGMVPTTWTDQCRKLITDFKCTKCGKIKRKIVKN
jgi:hypothetical protein